MSAHLDKIKKLLRLSKSSNQAEAELALSRAQELATRHNIDISFAEKESDKQEEDFTKEYVQGEGRRSYKTKLIDTLLQGFFHIRICYQGSSTFFVGTTQDIEVAKYFRTYLGRTFSQLASEAAKAYGWGFNRNSYYKGLHNAVYLRLRDSKEATERAEFDRRARESGVSAEEISSRYALVVTDKATAIKEKYDEFFPRSKSLKVESSTGFNEESYGAGRRDGDKVSITRPLEGSRPVAGSLGR